MAVDDQALIDDVLGGSQDGDHTLGAVYGVVRFLAFGGLTVLVGAVVFLAWLWPGRARRDRRGPPGRWRRRLAGQPWWPRCCASPCRAPTPSAAPSATPLDPTWSPTSSAPADRARSVGGAAGPAWPVARRDVAAPAAARPGRRRGPAPGRGRGRRLALLVTVTLTGHAVSGDLVPAGLRHRPRPPVGGERVARRPRRARVAVLWPSRRARRRRGADRRAGRRCSTAASAWSTGSRRWRSARCVAIVVSGVVQGWRQVGGYDALFDTTYGRLLVVKVAPVRRRCWWPPPSAAPGCASARGGPLGRGWRCRPAPAPWRRRPSERSRPACQVLRWSVARRGRPSPSLVLAVTALLVNAVPGETAAGGRRAAARSTPRSPRTTSCSPSTSIPTTVGHHRRAPLPQRARAATRSTAEEVHRLAHACPSRTWGPSPCRSSTSARATGRPTPPRSRSPATGSSSCWSAPATSTRPASTTVVPVP